MPVALQWVLAAAAYFTGAYAIRRWAKASVVAAGTALVEEDDFI